MAYNDDAARVWTEMHAYIAPFGTTAPTGVDQDLLAISMTPWIDLGRVATSGLSQSVSVDSKELTGYGAGGTLRTVNTNTKFEFKVALLEANAAAIALYEGVELDAITFDEDGEATWDSGKMTNERYCIVFDGLDGTSRIRKFVRSGQVSDRESLDWAEDDWASYGVTISANIGSDGKAVKTFLRNTALAS